MYIIIYMRLEQGAQSKPAGFDDMTSDEQMECIQALPLSERVAALDWVSAERFAELMSHSAGTIEEFNNPQRVALERLTTQLPGDVMKQAAQLMFPIMAHFQDQRDGQEEPELGEFLKYLCSNIDPADLRTLADSVENVAISNQDLQTIQSIYEQNGVSLQDLVGRVVGPGLNYISDDDSDDNDDNDNNNDNGDKNYINYIGDLSEDDSSENNNDQQ